MCVRYYACLTHLRGNFLRVLQAGGHRFYDIRSDNENGDEVPYLEEIHVKILEVTMR